MNRFKSRSALFLIVLLLISTLLPSQFTLASEISSGGYEIDYNEHVPADKAVPVRVAPGLSITAQEGELFSGGNIRFDIEGGSDETEKLILPDGTYGNITVSGNKILLDGDVIASVNDIFNGEGTSLQIDLHAIPVENGDFEKPLVNGEIQDWTINTSSEHPTKPGTRINQIWLGELATKTQGRQYKKFDASGGGLYTATGPNGDYEYTTDVDYSKIRSKENNAATMEGTEVLFKNGSGTLVKELIDENGNSRLQIGYKTGDIDNTKVPFGTVFRIDAWSTPFDAYKGDKLGPNRWW